nr:GspE/PulE family protein [Mesorhizobium sp. 1M-11]
MTELGLLGEQELAVQLSHFLELPVISDVPAVDGPEMFSAVTPGYLRENALLPLELDQHRLLLAVADPFAAATIDAVGFHFDKPVALRILPRRTITAHLESLEARLKETTERDLGNGQNHDAGVDDLERLKDFAREAPIVRFVAETIHQAVDANATDIHIEPLEDHVQIRFRRDGILSVVGTTATAMLAGIATRVKILARLNIAERRRPQDGRMRLAVRGRDIDLRVSIVPSIHGETIVLRVLDRSGVELKLDRLGFNDQAQTQIRNLSQAPNGIVLVTGPTGSGKTTTLYSILAECARTDVKIFTVEDPVEYRMAGITQLQVNPAIELDFAAALRSILRQDPDIILVGEIRDRETAQIAIQAALTGHLVFSTLHTNSAAGALTRLRDMGLDGYLLGATIRGVVAQRLLRRVCSACGQAHDTLKPCLECNGTGYRGRTVTHEILRVSAEIAALIDMDGSELDIQNLAVEQGLAPMRSHAQALVRQGITTEEEVRRVIDLRGEI